MSGSGWGCVPRIRCEAKTKNALCSVKLSCQTWSEGQQRVCACASEQRARTPAHHAHQDPCAPNTHLFCRAPLISNSCAARKRASMDCAFSSFLACGEGFCLFCPVSSMKQKRLVGCKEVRIGAVAGEGADARQDAELTPWGHGISETVHTHRQAAAAQHVPAMKFTPGTSSRAVKLHASAEARAKVFSRRLPHTMVPFYAREFPPQIPSAPASTTAAAAGLFAASPSFLGNPTQRRLRANPDQRLDRVCSAV